MSDGEKFATQCTAMVIWLSPILIIGFIGYAAAIIYWDWAVHFHSITPYPNLNGAITSSGLFIVVLLLISFFRTNLGSVLIQLLVKLITGIFLLTIILSLLVLIGYLGWQGFLWLTILPA